jgi:putative tryptophan/tyrosine transport system permease protein
MEAYFGILQGLSAGTLSSLPYIPAALGFYIALRCLRFPDLTVEGSFIFGQAITAFGTYNSMDPIWSIIFSLLGGAFLGGLTGFQHKFLKIPAFVCGIVTTFFITTFNYKLFKLAREAFFLSQQKLGISIPQDLSGEAPSSLNLPGFGIFENAVKNDYAQTGAYGELRVNLLIWLFILIVILLFIVFLFLRSKGGLQLRAFGVHRQAGEIYATKASFSVVRGLVLTNSLVAFSGSIYTQSTGLASIEMGSTLLIPLLAAVVMGEFIVDFLYPHFIGFLRRLRNKDFKRSPLLSQPLGLTIAPAVGFFTYNMIFMIIAAILLPKSDSISSYYKYLITASIILFILILRRYDNSFRLHPEDVI